MNSAGSKVAHNCQPKVGYDNVDNGTNFKEGLHVHLDIFIEDNI